MLQIIDTFYVYYYRATSIYTTQAYVRKSNSEVILLDVMLVGTNDGKILKIVMTYNDVDHIPLITEKLSVSIRMYSTQYS